MTSSILSENSSESQFLFEDRNQIRTIFANETIWFVAKDVATALEYQRFDSNLIANVPNEWVHTKPIRMNNITRNMLVLSEQGLYFFIGRSDKPKALPFQKWIAGEVLPSIRKTGNYSIQQPQTQNLQLPEIGNETDKMIELKNDVLETSNLIEILESKKPTTLYRLDKFYRKFHNFSPLEHFEINLDSQFFLPTELGKMINKSPVEINLMLEHKGFQIRENGVWKLTKSGNEFGIEIVGKFSQIKWKIKTII